MPVILNVTFVDVALIAEKWTKAVAANDNDALAARYISLAVAVTPSTPNNR